MAIVLGSFGTPAFGTGNITPGQPSSYNVGDILFILGGEYTGADAVPTATGFTQRLANTNTNRLWLFTRTATSAGSDTMPTINQAGGSHAQWCVCVPASGCTETVDVASIDRVSTSTQNFLYPNSTYTPLTAGDIVFAVSARQITTAHAGVTIGNLSNTNFGTAGAPNLTSYPNSTTGGFAINVWVQTTATAIAATMTQTTSFTDSTSAVMGFIVAFKPSTGGGGSLLLPANMNGGMIDLSGGF